MTNEAGAEECASMRLDQFLVYLRFVRTRSRARDLIEGHALRRNRKRVLRVSENVAIGDILTLPIGEHVRIVEVLALPDRRASAAIARSHYRELERH